MLRCETNQCQTYLSNTQRSQPIGVSQETGASEVRGGQVVGVRGVPGEMERDDLQLVHCQGWCTCVSRALKERGVGEAYLSVQNGGQSLQRYRYTNSTLHVNRGERMITTYLHCKGEGYVQGVDTTAGLQDCRQERGVDADERTCEHMW